jgi:hypothetical protein
LGKKGTYNFLKEKDEPFLWAKFSTKLLKEEGDLEASTKLPRKHPLPPSNLVGMFPRYLVRASKSPSTWGPWFPIPWERLHNE